MIEILTKKKFFPWFRNSSLDIKICDSLELLEPSKKKFFISCNTNIIIPKSIFSRFKIAINIHPGLYSFPGRDPHHWACYNKARFYGATAHIISEKVDQGKIIDFEKVEVKKLSPLYYHRIANKCSKILLKRTYDRIDNNTISNKPIIKAEWGKKVYKRNDLLKMCNFANIEKNEINLRKLAFKGFEKYFSYGKKN